VEPSGSFPFFHNSRFFECFPDLQLPVHIHKPSFSKKRIFIVLPCILPVLAANLLFLYLSPMCLSCIFPLGFGSVFYSYVPFLYYPQVYSFCVIFLCTFPALSSNVTFLYYPFIFLFCIVLPCTVSVLSPNVKFLYYSPVYLFCIILPCFLSALSCRVALLYYVPIYRFLIILPCTLYNVLTSYIFRLCIIFPRTVSAYIFRCTLGPPPVVKQLNMLPTSYFI